MKGKMPMQQQRKKRCGQGVVELALILPLFVLMFIAIIDFAWMFHSYTSVESMCIRAARIGTKRINQIVARNMFTSTTHATAPLMIAAFWESLSPLTPQSNFAPDSPVIDITVDNYRTVRVSATYHYRPLIGAFLPRGWDMLTLHRFAEERKE